MNLSLKTKINIGFGLGLTFLTIVSFLSYHNLRLLKDNAEWVNHTWQIKKTIREMTAEAIDLERNQRGYLLTGGEEYLESFKRIKENIFKLVDSVKFFTLDSEIQQSRLERLNALLAERIEVLELNILIRKSKGLNVALASVVSGRGKIIMDDLLRVAATIQEDEEALLDKRQKATELSANLAEKVLSFGSAWAILFILIALFIINKTESERERKNKQVELNYKIKTALNSLNDQMRGDQKIEMLCQRIINYLATFLNVPIGAIYLSDEKTNLKLAAGYALGRETTFPAQFALGEGLVGQAASEKRAISLSNTPVDYLKVVSGSGNCVAKHIHIVPFLFEDKIKGVIELASLSSFDSSHNEFLNSALENISLAIESAQNRERVATLLKESKQQEEELKSSNEELETKTQELKAQTEEMETTNEALEEKRRALEKQKATLETLNRDLESSKALIELKAKDLEQASRYKSEFLANMSHELRTPLNSILILARMLSDNGLGNLKEDQIKYAKVIHSSGSDLLTLINDILDLSKVEAGKLEINREVLSLKVMLDDLSNTFKSMMTEKKLEFQVTLSKDCPETIVSDSLRVKQILKNFLSNAYKFTAAGTVTLSVERPDGDFVTGSGTLRRESAIMVRIKDSGIGIPASQKAAIFEAFQQGDGSVSRKYGGTGLGLAIARQLARRLGGEIKVESIEGKGSEFFLYLPEVCPKNEDEKGDTKKTELPEPIHSEPTGISREHAIAHGIKDDRRNLEKGDRTVLVIEDDPHFAEILFEFCHKRGLKCLLSENGENGIADALQYNPLTIILDIKLPGMSGRAVLDKLKHDSRTRHIPVYVASVEPVEKEVLNMGAIGFLSKPVSKEGLESALEKIKNNILERDRHVLLIEDDEVARMAIEKLIENGQVKVTSVDNVARAASLLKEKTFDCIILDLGLKEGSGFEFLEILQKDEEVSKPPVIIYTGKEMSRAQREHLEEFTSSIIIKGTKSPERLLEEVTLFLHLVESELPPDKKKILQLGLETETIIEGKNILVVDDDMRNVYSLKEVLQQKKATVFVGTNGFEAIEQLEKNPKIDLVLMDIMMPKMDGYTAIKQIRSQFKFNKLPIVALTAKAMLGDREKCISAGANDYLAKPIDLDKLMSCLRIWLTKH